jgi:hypothetical protein
MSATPTNNIGGNENWAETDSISILIKQVTELTAKFKEMAGMSTQQTHSLFKQIESTKNKLRVEDNHFKNRQINRELHKKAALEKIIEG